MLAKRVTILTYEGDRFGRDLVQRKLAAILNGADVAPRRSFQPWQAILSSWASPPDPSSKQEGDCP